jgi:transposase
MLRSRSIDIEMCLRGLLRGYGLKVGPTRPKTFEARVRELATAVPKLTETIDALLTARASLLEQFRRLDRMVNQKAKQDERVKLLMSVPGVGALI